MDEKLIEKDDERKMLAYQREQMMIEREHEALDKLNKQEAFIKANKILKEERNERVLNERVLEQMEKLNYFPFTHGDMIEKQRAALQELQKHEQITEIRDRAAKEKERKINQAKLNQQANELMLLSF